MARVALWARDISWPMSCGYCIIIGIQRELRIRIFFPIQWLKFSWLDFLKCRLFCPKLQVMVRMLLIAEWSSAIQKLTVVAVLFMPWKETTTTALKVIHFSFVTGTVSTYGRTRKLPKIEYLSDPFWGVGSSATSLPTLETPKGVNWWVWFMMSWVN